jgi:signal transduction histidine kinase
MNPNKPLQNIHLGWSPFVAIAVTTLATIAISIYCLLSGWVIIFQNLFYVPIIIACVYYTKKGFAFSVVLSFIYLVIIIAVTRDPAVMIEALLRVVIFVGVAGVTTFLSMKLKQAEEELIRHREHLEELVAGRTKELRTANARLTEEVTERKRAEDELMQRAEDLTRSNAELEQFAYVASHDLQEPLRMVASYTQLLGKRYKGKLDGDADEFISFAVEGANRMKRLINDLLVYSRVGTWGQAPESVYSEQVLDTALASLQAAITESAAQVTHDPLPKVLADETQLGQVFQNLIGNAVKYRGDAPPRIHISVRQEGDMWVFSVRDNGTGIDPEYHERVFVIFQRLHHREEQSGTGIGLAVCKKIVERHGGRIWLESELGKGATFYFTIPAIAGTQLAA